MTDIADQVPGRLVAGDTWRWRRELSNYPAPTWAATWHFKNASRSFSVVGAADETAHAATVASTTTQDESPGVYFWALRVTSGAIVETVETGELVVAANPAAAGHYDGRSVAAKMVEQLEALALKRSLSGQASVSVDGVSVSFQSMADVIRALNFWRQELRNEKRKAGVIPGGRRNWNTRFGRPA